MEAQFLRWYLDGAQRSVMRIVASVNAWTSHYTIIRMHLGCPFFARFGRSSGTNAHAILAPPLVLSLSSSRTAPQPRLVSASSAAKMRPEAEHVIKVLIIGDSGACMDTALSLSLLVRGNSRSLSLTPQAWASPACSCASRTLISRTTSSAPSA